MVREQPTESIIIIPVILIIIITALISMAIQAVMVCMFIQPVPAQIT